MFVLWNIRLGRSLGTVRQSPKKVGTSCAACASVGALFLSTSVRISLQCIRCSPIANIFAHIFLLHLPDLDLPRVGIVSWHRKLWFYGWLFAKPTVDITCTILAAANRLLAWNLFPRRDYYTSPTTNTTTDRIFTLDLI